MRYEPSGQTLVMMRPTPNKDFKQNPEVNRTKRNLLIVLIIQLLLATAFFILRIISIIEHYKLFSQYGYLSWTESYVNNIIIVSIVILFYIVYTIAAVKYTRTGILILAWINLTALIIVLVTALIRFISILAFGTDSYHSRIAPTIIAMISVLIFSTINILVIKLSFNFAKLIKSLKTYQITENRKV